MGSILRAIMPTLVSEDVMKKTGILALVIAAYCAVPASSQLVQHEVRHGETLYGIARRYDLTVNQLTTNNSLESPDLLLPGTILVIPNRYRVERGDTLYSIARRFGTSVESLIEENGLATSEIRVGQIVTVPAGSVRIAATEEEEQMRPEGADNATDNEQPRSGTGEEAPPPKTGPEEEERIVVAAEISKPLQFSEGGIWPVAGSRRILEGKLPGVMISADRGAPVFAIAKGRVVYAGPHTTFGNVVFIQSSQDYIYVYGGQESIQVTVGDLVDAGTAIGSVGISPSEGHAALYFTVWRNNRFIDPESAPRG